MKLKFATWRLRRGMDRRFRSGHPWVYSNELMESPKGLEPGAWVELQDAGGKFLAWGFGNPQSLISFRSVSRDATLAEDPEAWVQEVLLRAGRLRARLGYAEVSYRLCFGEADGLPGLIIDRYAVVARQSTQVFVVQAHTAGADRLIPKLLDHLKVFVENQKSSENPGEGGGTLWERTAVVLRNDLPVRKMEGLEEEAPRVLRAVEGLHLENSRESSKQKLKIRVAPVLGPSAGAIPLQFEVDLLKGQKTGFFLDQFTNIQMAAGHFRQFRGSRVRILDLCSYVGQWGAQLARVFRDQGVQVEVLAVDASQAALEMAQRNIEAQGAICKTLKADVLKDLETLTTDTVGQFDVVISDPPALIQGRKNIPAGKHAYLQLATQAFRFVKPGGGIVCCSCSALLEEEQFAETIAKGAQRNQLRVQWVGRGCQASDHPMLLEFPEGRYLKSWIGLV